MTVKARFLLVENDQAFAALIERAFHDQKPFCPTVLAQTLAEAKRLLSEQDFDLILADSSLPDGQGLELLGTPEARELPLIVLTSRGSEQAAVEAMKAGAQDYMVKSPATVADIPRAAIRVVREWRGVVELKKTEKALSYELDTNSAIAALSGALVGGKISLDEIVGLILEKSRYLTGSPDGLVSSINPADSKTVVHAITDAACSRDQVCTMRILRLSFDKQHSDAGPWYGMIKNEPSAVDPDSIPALHKEIRRYCVVPAVLDGELAGHIVLANSERDYTDDDIAVVGRMARLYALAIQRTRREADLALAVDAANAANRAKTQFLANMSHELRTPLNGILGMVQLALSEAESGNQRHYLDLMLQEARKLLKIVNNLLELANIESGAAQALMHEFRLGGLVDSLLNTYSLQARLKNLDFAADLAKDLPEVLVGDPFRLRQILANLLENAIRHTHAGHVRLTVKAVDPATARENALIRTSQDFAGHCLILSVSDSGVGIPEEKRESIFESFTLAEEYLTKRYSGSGLGLSIAKQSAELLGGSILVESVLSKGSTFSVALPFWPAAAKTVEDKIPAAPLRPVRQLDILLVEDELTNRIAATKMLRRLGHSVTEAENGEEALSALVGKPFDIILMDIQMPVMDGLVATRHIRNGEVPGRAKNVPIVALTAYAMESDRDRFLAAGMNDYVSKPFELSDLTAAIDRAMGPAGQ